MLNRENEHQEGAQSLHRGVALLRAVAAAGDNGASAAELAKACGLARSTTHRLLSALLLERLIVKPPGGRRYFLGPLAYEIGLIASPHLGLREICAGIVRELAEATQDTAFLTLRSGLDGICIDRQSGAFTIQALTVEIGSRRPLGVGLGSISILAALPQHERDAVMRANGLRYREAGSLGTSHVQLMVERTHRQKFAHTASDFIPGVGGFALPIHDPDTNTVSAAISVASVVGRMELSRSAEILPLLEAAVRTIQTYLAKR